MKKIWIDLRSDTVTEPTIQMREAMLHAQVGDDVYGDDPTTTALETLAAELVGMEAALFVPSGTFGNQLAILTHCQRSDEVILGEDCHIIAHEVGAAALISGVQLRTLPTTKGKIKIDKIIDTIRKEEDIHYPKTSLICLENAYSNGIVVDLAYMQKVSEIAKQYQLKVHLDGARLFNAATALNNNVQELTQYTDTVMFCLSKGLCAPVGSILAGTNEFIDKARKNRKLLGGGMRQTGFLAAAGIIALKEMTKRLDIDHQNAKYLAQKLAEIPNISVDLTSLDINMVFFKIKDCHLSSKEIVNRFFEKQIKINPPENDVMRFVTHYWVNREDIDRTISVMKEICAKISR